MMGAPKLAFSLGRHHNLNQPMMLGDFLGLIHPDVYIFVAGASAGLYCGKAGDLLDVADLLDEFYRKRTLNAHLNRKWELGRLEKLDIQKELDKVNARLSEIPKHSKYEAKIRERKLLESKKRMLEKAPERIKKLREYLELHPEPDYSAPIMELMVPSYYSRHLSGEPPMWMIETNSKENGTIWLLSEMQDFIDYCKGDKESFKEADEE